MTIKEQTLDIFANDKSTKNRLLKNPGLSDVKYLALALKSRPANRLLKKLIEKEGLEKEVETCTGKTMKTNAQKATKAKSKTKTKKKVKVKSVQAAETCTDSKGDRIPSKVIPATVASSVILDDVKEEPETPSTFTGEEEQGIEENLQSGPIFDDSDDEFTATEEEANGLNEKENVESSKEEPVHLDDIEDEKPVADVENISEEVAEMRKPLNEENKDLNNEPTVDEIITESEDVKDVKEDEPSFDKTEEEETTISEDIRKMQEANSKKEVKEVKEDEPLFDKTEDEFTEVSMTFAEKIGFNIGFAWASFISIFKK